MTPEDALQHPWIINSISAKENKPAILGARNKKASLNKSTMNATKQILQNVSNIVIDSRKAKGHLESKKTNKLIQLKCKVIMKENGKRVSLNNSKVNLNKEMHL